MKAQIERGTLRQLFDVAVPSASAYWLVWPEDRVPSDRLLAFRDWIHAEAARPVERPSPVAGKTVQKRRAARDADGLRGGLDHSNT